MPIIGGQTFYKRMPNGRTIRVTALDHRREGDLSAVRFLLRADQARSAFGLTGDEQLAFLRTHAIEPEATGEATGDEGDAVKADPTTRFADLMHISYYPARPLRLKDETLSAVRISFVEEHWYDLREADASALQRGDTEGLTIRAFIERKALGGFSLPYVRPAPVAPKATGDEADAAWPYPFQIGDLVELKSGGHRMVVTGLQCSEGTCGDPYKGELRLVEVAWSIQSQMDGDDISREELDPRLLQPAVILPHERTPF